MTSGDTKVALLQAERWRRLAGLVDKLRLET
jgi:hypothetical protein